MIQLVDFSDLVVGETYEIRASKYRFVGTFVSKTETLATMDNVHYWCGNTLIAQHFSQHFLKRRTFYRRVSAQEQKEKLTEKFKHDALNDILAKLVGNPMQCTFI